MANRKILWHALPSGILQTPLSCSLQFEKLCRTVIQSDQSSRCTVEDMNGSKLKLSVDGSPRRREHALQKAKRQRRSAKWPYVMPCLMPATMMARRYASYWKYWQTTFFAPLTSDTRSALMREWITSLLLLNMMHCSIMVLPPTNPRLLTLETDQIMQNNSVKPVGGLFVGCRRMRHARICVWILDAHLARITRRNNQIVLKRIGFRWLAMVDMFYCHFERFCLLCIQHTAFCAEKE